MNNYVVKYFPDDPNSTVRYYLAMDGGRWSYTGVEHLAKLMSSSSAETLAKRFPMPPGMTPGGWTAVAQPACLDTVQKTTEVGLQASSFERDQLILAISIVLQAGLDIEACTTPLTACRIDSCKYMVAIPGNEGCTYSDPAEAAQNFVSMLESTKAPCTSA